MQTSELLSFISVLVIAIGSFIISIFQFKEKGFLFNNAYIYASKEERKTMNKKPHYKQSAISFFFIGLIFLTNAIQILLDLNWLFWLSILFAVIGILHAIISAILIEKKAADL